MSPLTRRGKTIEQAPPSQLQVPFEDQSMSGNPPSSSRNTLRFIDKNQFYVFIDLKLCNRVILLRYINLKLSSLS
jgi:hypothetical protein